MVQGRIEEGNFLLVIKYLEVAAVTFCRVKSLQDVKVQVSDREQPTSQHTPKDLDECWLATATSGVAQFSAGWARGSGVH